MVTVSPNTPAFPATLMRSCKNFSKEVMSMILSSTGFPQSMVKVCAFFFPLVPPAGFFATTAGAIRRITKTKILLALRWKTRERKRSKDSADDSKRRRENEGRRYKRCGGSPNPSSASPGWTSSVLDVPRSSPIHPFWWWFTLAPISHPIWRKTW